MALFWFRDWRRWESFQISQRMRKGVVSVHLSVVGGVFGVRESRAMSSIFVGIRVSKLRSVSLYLESFEV